MLLFFWTSKQMNWLLWQKTFWFYPYLRLLNDQVKNLRFWPFSANIKCKAYSNLFFLLQIFVSPPIDDVCAFLAETKQSPDSAFHCFVSSFIQGFCCQVSARNTKNITWILQTVHKPGLSSSFAGTSYFKNENGTILQGVWLTLLYRNYLWKNSVAVINRFLFHKCFIIWPSLVRTFKN